MIITSPKAEPRESTMTKRQTVIVPKMGPYYGFLARYVQPKEYTSNTKRGVFTAEKVGFAFVLTHDQAFRQLPKFAEAFVLVKNEHGHNGDWVAPLTQYIYALTYGKQSYDEIVDGVFDYDTFVGRPVELMIEPGQGKNGARYNNVKGIGVVDKDAAKAMKALMAERKFEKNEKTEQAQMVVPAAEFEEEDAAPQAASADLDFDGLDGEPF